MRYFAKCINNYETFLIILTNYAKGFIFYQKRLIIMRKLEEYNNRYQATILLSEYLIFRRHSLIIIRCFDMVS